MRMAALALGLALLPAARTSAGDRPTYSVDYVVSIRRRDPGRAHVRWLLAGIDEIAGFRLVFRDGRTTKVQGTGSLVWEGRTLRWKPGGPYAHLTYTVDIDRRRPANGPHFDSHADATWIATRAVHLFPEIHVTFHAGKTHAHSRARLIFHLPPGWRSAAAGEPLGEGQYVVHEPGKRLDRPRGWYLLGRITRHTRTFAGATVTIAIAPGSTLDLRRLVRLYRHTFPLMKALLGPPPPRLLVVSAPDPMWHGGLSGEDSFFVNGHIPIRSPDKTSTYLHELFHCWQPFHPVGDGRWVSEGLAEYYSLVLPHRAGRMSDASFARGIALFARYGRWGVDLSRTTEAAAFNNSGPLVMHWIDHEIARASGGAHHLDDVVRRLAEEGGGLTTARFQAAVSAAAGEDLAPLFRRYVFGGARPPVGQPADPGG
jgi:predicted metalloprotease with PDZ domain